MIEDSISFLIIKFVRLLNHSLMTRIVEEGLKPSYFLPIYYLSTNKNVTQSDICNFTGYKAPTISLLLKDMEKDELVTRNIDEVDSRKIIVSLTDRGNVLAKPYHDIFMEIDHKFINGLNNEDKIVLRNIITNLIKNVKDEGDSI